MNSITLTLAGRPYEIGRTYSRANMILAIIGVIAAALSKDHPELTVQKLRELEITSHELIAAFAAVIEHAGLVAGDRGVHEARGTIARPGQ